MTKILMDKRYRLTIILTLVIGVLASYMFVIYPLFKRWRSIGDEVAVAKARYVKHRALLENIDEYKALYVEHEDALHLRGSDEEVAALFLKDLEGFVEKAGLAIVDIKVLPKLYETGVVRFLVQVEMESEVPQFIEFLKVLSTTNKLIAAERLTVERKGAQQQILSIHAVFSLVKAV